MPKHPLFYRMEAALRARLGEEAWKELERREKEIMNPSVIAGCVWWVSGKCLHRGRYAEDCKENECPICQIIELERRERMTLENEKLRRLCDELHKQLARELESVNELGEANIKLRDEISELKSIKFARFANEECWIYQGDGEDHLESLVCPVVISAEKLIELEAEVKRLKQEIRYPHIDCFYNGGCGCNNLRLGVEPKEGGEEGHGGVMNRPKGEPWNMQIEK